MISYTAVNILLHSGTNQNYSQLNGLQGPAGPFGGVWPVPAWSGAQSDQQVAEPSVINGASQQLRSSRAVLSDQQHDMLNLLDGTATEFNDISGMFNPYN